MQRGNFIIVISVTAILVVLIFFLNSKNFSFNKLYNPHLKQNNETIPKHKNILMIGNSITYFNNLPSNLIVLLNKTKSKINIDTLFSPGCNIDVIISHLFYPSASISSTNIPEKYKVWKHTNLLYKDFADYLSDFDIIYVQTQGLNDPTIYEILKSMSETVNCSTYILLVENYSSVTWNKNVRKRELNENRLFYQSNKVNSNIILIPIGEKFHTLMSLDSTIDLTDDSNHPTIAGSNLMCNLIFNTIDTLIN